MIRINLLATDRGAAVKKGGAIISPAQRVTVGAAFILMLTVGLIGWWYWSMRSESVQLDADIAHAEIEAQQLRSVLAQVQKFETRKATLQQRVTLIEQLRRGQSAPVHVLDELSKSLPDRLWLTTLTQRDKDFTIEGRATSLTALSDFVANLETSRWFKRPVEILDSAVEPSTTGNGDLVRFTIRATSDDPDAPAVAAPRPLGRGAPPVR